jgi:nicotinate-nucleotide adenylyltransferase
MTATDGGSLRRVGVFGGTFDPPHNAHLLAAATARDVLRLDRVLLVVAGDPWQKTASVPVTAAHHRLAMTQLLVEGVDGLEVSDVEVRRSGPSYTVDTLAELASTEEQLVLILGDDALAGIATWHRPSEVVRLAQIAAVQRPGVNDGADGQLLDARLILPAGRHVERFEIPRMDISSSDLRRRLRSGATVCGMLPPPVASYALRHGLYREQP